MDVSMNSVRVRWVIRKTVFNVYLCLNDSWNYEHNQFERRDKNQDTKGSFLKIYTIFILTSFS